MRVIAFLLVAGAVQFAGITHAQQPRKQIPDPLKSWQDWVTWDDPDPSCPTPYQDANRHLSVWPSVLNLKVDRTSAQFDLTLTVYQDAWVALPGGREAWPLEVKANGSAVPVVEHDGRPSVHFGPGTYRLTGSYRWDEMPSRIALPREIGVLSLVLDGQPVEAPSWDADGFLWLRRARAESTDKDFLGTSIYRVIEDGIPMWLRTQIELSVAGKSREEDLGTLLPEGWRLAAVDSPLPIAIDEQGRAKVQVRAGKWVIRLDAFRITPAAEIRFAAGATPALAEELIAFRAAPEFRMLEIEGLTSIDVSQTTFPQAWRELPVYRWETASPFRLSERMRGMGLQKPEGLTIHRDLWLSESGRDLTYRDRLSGRSQEIWRLDAAARHDLGSLRSAGQGQLVTLNPKTHDAGVELRTRTLDLEATGRIHPIASFSATGWKIDADTVDATLNLPPGWRLFAVFGPDWVQGDWLTTWSLLDLFLLIVFSFAVYRLWGIGAGLLALVAFGLSYHEPDAPRFLWIALLVPLALLRVVPQGKARRLLVAGKYVLLALLLLSLIPFLAGQIQQALYPQLENDSSGWGLVRVFEAAELSGSGASALREAPESAMAKQQQQWEGKLKMNLMYDTKARIQTGPGVPEWEWQQTRFGWNGPVAESQNVSPVLIPPWLHRLLSLLRVALLLALAGVLLGAWRVPAGWRGPRPARAVLVILGVWAAGWTAPASAQIPDPETLQTLRARLTEPPDAYPHAADIPSVLLTIKGRRVLIDAEIHASIRTAVPIPGRLSAWSPLKVTVDGKPEAALRRDDGYLWVVLPAGVHRVQVEGWLADVTEWEWTFQLRPRHVTIDAPGWTVSGVHSDGVPEQQVFFTLRQKSNAAAATYDRQELQAIAALDRNLELGLVWQVHNEVTRLSPPGKALSIRVPLLPGEKVLSSNLVPKDGYVDVRLGAYEQSFSWDSELAPTDHLELRTRADDAWIERWHLVASPVWNVALSGLPPVFEAAAADLVPVWHPWPGESVDLVLSRPEAVTGATITVHNVRHEIALGARQRTSNLHLQVQCSVGEDFGVTLPSDAAVTSLTHAGTSIPVRKDGERVIIPLRPGDQAISMQWKTNQDLAAYASADPIQFTSEAGQPIESANIHTKIEVPSNRWVLWTAGPLRGPAVRFWVILACSVVAAWILARLPLSPLRFFEWLLLAIGLTQVSLFAGFWIVGWFFLLAWRGKDSFQQLSPGIYNFWQVVLPALTLVSLLIFIGVVSKGLLGEPEMFIAGNDSTSTTLRWYQDRAQTVLPAPAVISISIWWYRLLMLAWAFWLATSVIRWLAWSWEQFSKGGRLRRPAPPNVPPPIPAP